VLFVISSGLPARGLVLGRRKTVIPANAEIQCSRKLVC
jgi:hypothetical protein